MALLNFPDVNLWFALAVEEHPHASRARTWWDEAEGVIAFSRFSQLGLLRLLTTASAMDDKPLTMREAWRVHDRFYTDGRVAFVGESADTEVTFRRLSASQAPSPRVWADAWMLAVAQSAAGVVITFDRALGTRGAQCLLSTN